MKTIKGLKQGLKTCKIDNCRWCTKDIEQINTLKDVVKLIDEMPHDLGGAIDANKLKKRIEG